MKKFLKNNQGITLVALTITVLVITIIASVSTYAGINLLKESKDKAHLSEVAMVQQAIVESYTKYKMTQNAEKYLIGIPLNRSEVANEIPKLIGKIELQAGDYGTAVGREPNYYYKLTASDLEELEITKTENTFIVNYETGEVMNATIQLTSSGKPLYIKVQSDERI